jgi:hypothetical protein
MMANGKPWSPDSRYLWCHTPAPPSLSAALHVIDVTNFIEVATLGPAQLGGLSPRWVWFSPRGDWALLTASKIGREYAHSREVQLFTARPDGIGVRPWAEIKGSEEILGWTWDGEVLLCDVGEKGAGPTRLIRLNPQTGAQRVIYPPPR